MISSMAHSGFDREVLPGRDDYRSAIAIADTPSEPIHHLDMYVIELAQEWLDDTHDISSFTQMKNVPSFLKLISLGRHAIPALLEVYAKTTRSLFIVLQEITGTNPVDERDYGDVAAIRDAWLVWGRNYVSDSV